MPSAQLSKSPRLPHTVWGLLVFRRTNEYFFLNRKNWPFYGDTLFSAKYGSQSIIYVNSQRFTCGLLLLFIGEEFNSSYSDACRYSDWLRAGRSGDRIPVEARFFAHFQTGSGAHQASCTMGTGSFPGVKRPGRGADHPDHPSAEVEYE
jgi:hypothetical protein